MSETVAVEKIVSLCKRRGFIFQSSEIYGGLGSCWDYGPSWRGTQAQRQECVVAHHRSHSVRGA